MPLRPLLQTTFIKSLDANNYKAASDSLPTKISLATKEPPISDVEKIVGRGKVVIFIKLELVKVNERVSVSGNLTPEQTEFVATQLVELFPNESLADFKLCFERGCIGQYGEIFRMDGIVLRKWMEQYLDEKYTVIEDELRESKDSLYELPDKADEGPGYREFKEWAKTLQMGVKVPGMTDADNRKYGQEKPAKRNTATAGYKYFTVFNIQVYALTQEHAEQLVELMIQRGELEAE